MPTPAERTALLFLSGVLLAGGVVRLTRAVTGGHRPPAAASALADQRRSLDSAAESRRRPPPRTTRPATVTTQTTPAAPPPPILVNSASAAELESLPRIGPALAARIVAERDANGPFTNLAALESRVRGIGPALARTIEPLIRF